jgi:hypothetical protein
MPPAIAASALVREQALHTTLSRHHNETRYSLERAIDRPGREGLEFAAVVNLI